MNLFMYCSNNPVMGFDPTGNSWLGDKWEAFTDWLGSIFGASASVSHTAEYEEELLHPLSPISATTGISETIVEKTYGDSSKLFSVYANCESTNMIASSSAGLKINVGKFTLKISLGLDNIGVSGSFNDESAISEFGLQADLTKLRIEGKYSVTQDTTTTYSKGGVDGRFIAAIAFAVQTGDVSMLQRAYAR